MKRNILITIFSLGIFSSVSGSADAPNKSPIPPLVSFDEGTAWQTELDQAPPAVRQQINRIQQKDREGSFSIEEGLDRLLHYYGLQRKAKLVDLVGHTYEIRIDAARFIYKDSSDCAYPDHIEFDYDPSHLPPSESDPAGKRGPPGSELNGFLSPSFLSVVKDYSSKDPAAYRQWQAYAKSHFEEWKNESGAEQVDDLWQSAWSKVSTPAVILHDTREAGGYEIFIENPGQESSIRRFYLDRQGQITPLPSVDYPPCGS
jgi:hypothetical protein